VAGIKVDDILTVFLNLIEIGQEMNVELLAPQE